MKDNLVELNLDSSKITGEFIELLKRVYKDKPQKSDLSKLEKYLKETPGLWRILFDTTNVLQINFVKRMVGQKAAHLAIHENIAELKQGLNFNNSSTLEQLLIENIISTWLNYQWTNYQLMPFMGQAEVRLTILEFWEKRVSMSQTRYLRACETLAKVRRLMSLHPLVQVNIAKDNSQQVNIARDFVKQETKNIVEP